MKFLNIQLIKRNLKAPFQNNEEHYLRRLSEIILTKLYFPKLWERTDVFHPLKGQLI